MKPSTPSRRLESLPAKIIVQPPVSSAVPPAVGVGGEVELADRRRRMGMRRSRRRIGVGRRHAVELVGEGDLLARGSQIRGRLDGEIVGEVVGEAGDAGVGAVDRGAAAEQARPRSSVIWRTGS